MSVQKCRDKPLLNNHVQLLLDYDLYRIIKIKTHRQLTVMFREKLSEGVYWKLSEPVKVKVKIQFF